MAIPFRSYLSIDKEALKVPSIQGYQFIHTLEQMCTNF